MLRDCTKSMRLLLFSCCCEALDSPRNTTASRHVSFQWQSRLSAHRNHEDLRSCVCVCENKEPGSDT